jgi:hypothetical protein
MIQVSDSAFPFGLGDVRKASRSDPKEVQGNGPMKNNSWEVEIPEEDHGEGADIMVIVEADLATLG